MIFTDIDQNALLLYIPKVTVKPEDKLVCIFLIFCWNFVKQVFELQVDLIFVWVDVIISFRMFPNLDLGFYSA
jgi:hypothetical protein